MKFALAVLAALVASASGAPIDTCMHQSKCVTFTVEKITDGDICAGSCYWKICMTLSDVSGECPKVSFFLH